MYVWHNVKSHRMQGWRDDTSMFRKQCEPNQIYGNISLNFHISHFTTAEEQRQAVHCNSLDESHRETCKQKGTPCINDGAFRNICKLCHHSSVHEVLRTKQALWLPVELSISLLKWHTSPKYLHHVSAHIQITCVSVSKPSYSENNSFAILFITWQQQLFCWSTKEI